MPHTLFGATLIGFRLFIVAAVSFILCPALLGAAEIFRPDSLFADTDQLLLSNHQQKALQVIVPEYYQRTRTGDTTMEFQKIAYQFARVMERTDQHSEALQATERWLAKDWFNPYFKARLWLVQALVFEKIQEQQGSQWALDSAHSIIIRHQWPELNAEFLVRQTSFYRIFNTDASARVLAQKALTAAQQAGNLWHIADSYLLLGFTDTGRANRLFYLGKALSVYKQIADTTGIGFMYLNLASQYYKAGKQDVAMSYLDSTRPYIQTSNFAELRAAYFYDRTEYLEARGNFEDALSAFHQATELQKQLDDEFRQAIIYSEKYKLEDAKAAELDQLKRSSDAERAVMQKERSTFIFYMVVLTGMTIIILYLYYLRQKQGKIILNDKLIIQQRNQKLEGLLTYNELLLNELQHRVKNNLQFIISMISMQLDMVSSEDSKTALNSVLGRVGAIASVHEKLYSYEEGGEVIDQKTYIKNILDNLEKFVNIEGITIDLDIEVPSLDTKRSMALGMMITELVTNSVKHAFEPGAKSARIRISLKWQPDDQNILFTYRDNGIGTTTPKENALGLHLIRLFSQQLKGTPEMSFERGYSLKLTFPISRHGK